VQVFTHWQDPLNLVTDSQYVANIVTHLEKAWLKHVDNEPLFLLFKQLWDLLCQRTNPYYVLHIRSHTALPGIITEGNARADHLAAPAWAAPVPNTIEQAQLSHTFFYQSAKMLRHQFRLPWTVARTIVQTCPNCQQIAPLQPAEVNPRGLQALQLWQTDVTHIPEFGRQKYVHVSVDTFSGAVWGMTETGGRGRDIL